MRKCRSTEPTETDKIADVVSVGSVFVGTSLTLLTADGTLAGHTLYDAYGGVLSSTVPATLTHALTELPEADTGLVHLGGGRYYDPALGRPLQSNSAGGLPGVPQSLNRYAASALGQPGVAAGVASDLNLWPDIFGWAKGAALDLAAFIPIEQGYFGQARVTLQASHSKLTRQVFRQYGQDLFEGISGPIPGKLRQTSTTLPLFSPTRDGIDEVAETIATRLRGNLGFSLRRINIQVEVIEGTLTARYIKLGTFR